MVCQVSSERADVDVLIAALSDIAQDEVDTALTRARAVGTKVLLLLDGSTNVDVTGAAGARCDGYLDIGDLTAETMADALHRVVRGDVPMPTALTRDLLAHVRAGAGTRTTPVSLTPRERQVLSLMVEGLSNKQIAHRIDISQHGVKRLVANVLAKLNCPNRTLAVSRVLREQLYPTPGGTSGRR
jgi:DNA-binding NarL/FixJ family response regulator